MKFSVFGSNGFIGSNLVNFLKSQKIECHELEPNDEKIFEKPLGHVIYCIGVTADFREKPLDTVNAHVCLLHKILKKCKFDSFLYLSSTRVYANSSTTNEDAQLIVNPNKFEEIYNISKIMGESLCLASEKPNVRIVRLSNVVGNNSNIDDFLSSLIYDAIINKKIILHTTLDSEKDYVHVNDVVNILPKISLHGKNSIYNIASGQNLSNEKIMKKIQEITNCGFEVAENNELHDSSEEILSKIQDEEEFQKLIDEKAAINVMRYHHTMILSECMDEWTEYILKIAYELLEGNGKLSDDIKKQFYDISNYCRGKCHNPLGENRMETNPEFTFNYDIDKWLEDKLDLSSLDKFQLSKPQKIIFTLNEEQFRIIRDNVDLFGHTTVGYTRALKHVQERMFWRNPMMIT